MMKKTALIAILAAVAAAHAGDWNGGRTVPVHRFAPVDASGDRVSAASGNPRAISLVKTCGQCHETDQMAGGSHFRTGGTNDVAKSADKEPWFLRCGSNLCKTVSLEDKGGLSAWEWTKTFGFATPGGGIASCEEAMCEAAGERQRWFVTGPLEMNCLACHSHDGFDISEWTKQILRENWSGAALAASGIARVEGMNARLDSSWDPLHGENPDDHAFKVPQKIVYNPANFDDKGQCLFRVGKPRNENCLACHATAAVGTPAHKTCENVHIKRGMRCIDCHSNGMDHRIGTKSCRSCHLEDGGEGPKPVHAGIPLVHFEKLSCAVCHSGITEDGKRAQVRTMRANRIGIYGKAHWETDVPFIEEPFFRKNADGKVEILRRAALDGTNFAYWAFAHDVKPARMARGASAARCAECHSKESGFFDGWENPVYFSALNLAFLGRPVFKIFLWSVFAFLCLFAAAAAAVSVSKLSERMGRLAGGGIARFAAAATFCFAASIACLAASGIAGWAAGGMTSWPLMLHMVAGGAMAASCGALALLRQGGSGANGAFRSMVWTLWLVLGACTVFTAVMPMMCVFGSQGQLFLLWSHRIAGLAFAALSCAAAIPSRRSGN